MKTKFKDKTVLVLDRDRKYAEYSITQDGKDNPEYKFTGTNYRMIDHCSFPFPIGGRQIAEVFDDGNGLHVHVEDKKFHLNYWEAHALKEMLIHVDLSVGTKPRKRLIYSAPKAKVKRVQGKADKSRVKARRSKNKRS